MRIIVPKFLPRGWRLLREREIVENGDFHWSERMKCYLPAKKIHLRSIAGHVVPFVRRINESERQENGKSPLCRA